MGMLNILAAWEEKLRPVELEVQHLIKVFNFFLLLLVAVGFSRVRVDDAAAASREILRAKQSGIHPHRSPYAASLRTVFAFIASPGHFELFGT